jgi:hypothetical protein
MVAFSSEVLAIVGFILVVVFFICLIRRRAVGADRARPRCTKRITLSRTRSAANRTSANSSPSSTLPQVPASRRFPTRVFLAYRREDSGDITGRIYDKLIDHLIRKHVGQVVADCEIMLVVIGAAG